MIIEFQTTKISDNISPQHKNPTQIYYTVFVLYFEALCKKREGANM